VGRVATTDIQPSQILLGDMLSADKVAAGVSALLPEGQRAFSIRVSEDQIIGGLLRVNDRVDVFVTLPGSVFPQSTSIDRREADQSRATLLLQDVAVLAVGEKLSTKGPDAINGVRTVSLAIAPDAVARLALADRLGKVTLAIRNPSDTAVTPESSVTLADLGSGTVASADATPAPTARKAAEAGGHRITIYSGANTTTVTTSR
jgi:pilus assembly protein CpaB